MNKEPLAYRLRPITLDEVYGQEHLTNTNGILRKCVQQHVIFSMILFGPPGTGKTTLATVLANELQIPYRMFNAVTSNKKDLEKIFFYHCLYSPKLLYHKKRNPQYLLHHLECEYY